MYPPCTLFLVLLNLKHLDSKLFLQIFKTILIPCYPLKLYHLQNAYTKGKTQIFYILIRTNGIYINESFVLYLKILFLKYLFEWMDASSLFSFASLIKILDGCNFKVKCWYFPCTWVVPLCVYLMKYLLIKKVYSFSSLLP